MWVINKSCITKLSQQIVQCVSVSVCVWERGRRREPPFLFSFCHASYAFISSFTLMKLCTFSLCVCASERVVCVSVSLSLSPSLTLLLHSFHPLHKITRRSLGGRRGERMKDAKESGELSEANLTPGHTRHRHLLPHPHHHPHRQRWFPSGTLFASLSRPRCAFLLTQQATKCTLVYGKLEWLSLSRVVDYSN